MDMAWEFAHRIHHKKSQTGNCGHYYVDKGGLIECFVAPEYEAHHVIDYNPRSIGIELVNRGRYPDWFHKNNQEPDDPYPEIQIEQLIRLIEALTVQCPNMTHIAGHEDLDQSTIVAEDDDTVLIKRKIDPGPMFPWQHVFDRIALQPLKP